MDLLTLSGGALGLGAVAYVLIQGGAARTFLDPDSAILVFGGTFGATMITHSWAVVKRVPASVRLMFFPPKRRAPEAMIEHLLELRENAAAQGIDAIALDRVDDAFLRDGLRMLVEDHDEKTVKEELDTQIDATDRRHQRLIDVFRSMGTYAPVFGLLGTLIGVVQVLKNLDNAQLMGQYMALAITTTFYGIFASNFLFLPVAGKLESLSDEETLLMELASVGLQSIRRGELPTPMRRRLERFLAGRTRKPK